MPQRPEDYQSTKNVGGNKLGGTDAGHNPPFAYLKLTPEHAYLGHFRQSRYLEQGHNERRVNPSGGERMDPTPTPGGSRSSSSERLLGPNYGERLGARAVRRRLRSSETPSGDVAALKASKPVVASRFGARAAVREARATGREAVRAARSAGGDVGAARAARREAVSHIRSTRKELVKLARGVPESARMERKARRSARKGR